MIHPERRESPRHVTAADTKQQVKRIIEQSPHKLVNDDLSTTHLFKKLIRRKLSVCLQKLNTGQYRPKPTNVCGSQDDDDDDGELGSPQPKKQRLEPAEKCRWEKLSEKKQEKSSARQGECASETTW